MLMRIHKLLIALLVLTTSSCGYFSDGPVENSDLYTDTNSLSGQCELNPDEFGRIFDRDIQAQIKCVRDNFLQFNRYVRTNDSDNISEDELQLFISKFFAKNSDTIIMGLQVLFEVNMLLLRDHAGNLSRGNIDPLYELLLSLNKQGVEVAQVLKKMTGQDRHLYFHEERKKLQESLNQLSKRMLELINQRTGLPQNLDIKDFVLGLNDSFDVGGDRFDEELVESLIFLKKLFLGGKKDTVTSDEMVKLVKLFPDLVIEAFDLIFSTPELFENEKEHYAFYQTKIFNLSGLLYPISDNQTLFSEDDIFRIYEAIVGEEELLDLKEYKVIIQGLKRNIIGGHPKNYTFKDLQKALLTLNIGIEGLSYYNDAQNLVKNLKVAKSQDLSSIRQSLLSRTKSLQDGIHLRVNELPHLPESVSILDFFKTLNAEIPAMEYDIDLIEALFAVKTLSVGGKKDVLTKKEFYAALEKLPRYVNLFFDFRFEFHTLTQVDERTSFFTRQLQTIEEMLVELDDDRTILTESDVFTLIRALEEDPKKQKELKAIFHSFQTNILSSRGPDLNFSEFKKSLDYAKVLNQTANFFETHKKWLEKIDQAQNRTDFRVAKSRYLAELQDFVSQLKKLVLQNDIIKEGERVQIFSFLSEIIKNMDNISIDPAFYEDLLPIKQALLGGDKNSLTRAEFLDFTSKVPSLASNFLDVYKYGIFDQDFSFFVEASKTLQNSLFSQTDNLDLFHMSEIIDLANRFSDLPFDQFSSTLKKLKLNLLGGDQDIVTLKDIKKLVSFGQDFAEQLYFNDVTYESMKTFLNKTYTKINEVPNLDLPSYSILRKSRLEDLRSRFKKSVIEHRYFTEKESGLQFWGHPYRRSKFGFQQLNTVKWLATKLVKGWGHKQDKLPTGHAISLEEIETALNDFKPILEEYGLWTTQPKTFARNTLLLGDLFQNKSNGDMQLDVNELTEYGTMVLSAITLSNNFLTNLLAYCDPVNGNDLSNYSFHDFCYRKRLFPILFDELNYKRYLPMLSKFVDDSRNLFENNQTHNAHTHPMDKIEFSSEENQALNYLVNVEGFVRDQSTSEVSRRDFTLVLGAIVNIETTFLRFDENKNNQLDPKEIDKAFEVYKEAIISVANLSDSQRKYAKTIFLYMLKEMRIPSTWELLTYHYNPFANKEIVAYRLNVGALLFWLVRQ